MIGSAGNGLPVPVPGDAVLAHAGVHVADQVADHRIAGSCARHLFERRVGAVQLAVADEQFGELRPRSGVVGL